MLIVMIYYDIDKIRRSYNKLKWSLPLHIPIMGQSWLISINNALICRLNFYCYAVYTTQELFNYN